MPEPYQTYYYYVDKLKFTEEPDYHYLRNLFVQHRRMQSILSVKSSNPSNNHFQKMGTIEECSMSKEFSISYNPVDMESNRVQMSEEMLK